MELTFCHIVSRLKRHCNDFLNKQVSNNFIQLAGAGGGPLASTDADVV
jgi:hypothetical protein